MAKQFNWLRPETWDEETPSEETTPPTSEKDDGMAWLRVGRDTPAEDAAPSVGRGAMLGADAQEQGAPEVDFQEAPSTQASAFGAELSGWLGAQDPNAILDTDKADDVERKIRRRQAARAEREAAYAPGLLQSGWEGLKNAASLPAQAVGTVFDTPARGMRTATNEGAWTPIVNNTPIGWVMQAMEGQNPFSPTQRLEDYKQAGQALGAGWDAMWSPDEAATSDDLYRLSLKQLAGKDKTLGEDGDRVGRVADFVGRMAIEFGQDPTTYLSAGALPVAKQLQGQALKYVNALSKGEDTLVAAREFKALTGVEPTAEAMRTLGLEARLSERVAKGQSGIRLSVPGLDTLLKREVGIPITGPLAAKPLQWVDKVSDTTREVLKSVDNRALNLFSGPDNMIRKPTLGWFAEGSGSAGVDALLQFTQGRAYTKVQELAERGAVALDDARKAGVVEDDLRLITAYAETHLSKTHIDELAKLTSKPPEELTAKFRERFKPEDIELAIRQKGYTHDQVKAIAIAADKMRSIYDDSLALMLHEGEDIVTLGQSVRADVATAQSALIDYMDQLGVPKNLIYKSGLNGPELGDFAKSIREGKITAGTPDGQEQLMQLLADYEHKVDVAAKVPGYVPLRVNPHLRGELADALADDSAVSRELRNRSDYIPTLEEANRLIRESGARALVGKKPEAKLTLGQIGRAFMDGWKAPGKVGETLKKLRQEGAEFFETHPGLALQRYLQGTAKRLGHKEYAQGIRAFGDELPKEVRGLVADIKNTENELRALAEGRGKVQRAQQDLPGMGGHGKEFASDTALGTYGGGRRLGGAKQGDLFNEFAEAPPTGGGHDLGSLQAGRRFGGPKQGNLFNEFAEAPPTGGGRGLGTYGGGRDTATSRPFQSDLVEQSDLERSLAAKRAHGGGRVIEPEYIRVAREKARQEGTRPQAAELGPQGASSLPADYVDMRGQPGQLPRDFVVEHPSGSSSLTPDFNRQRAMADLELSLQAKREQLRQALGPYGVAAGRDLTLASEALGKLPEGMDDFLLPSDVAIAIKRQKEMLKSPEVYKRMPAFVGEYMRAWKSVLIGTPGAQSRNVIGNTFLRMQGGGIDQHSIQDAKRLIENWSWEFFNGKRGTDPAKTVFDIGGGRTITGDALRLEASKLGAVDNGLWGGEMDAGGLGFTHLNRKAPKSASTFIDKAAQVSGAPKRFVGKYADTSREIASGIENADKMGFLLARLRAGDTMEQAAISANEFLFNYRNVSPAIRALRGFGLAPFAAWSAKNIPLQLRMAMERPAQFMSMIHAKRAIEQGVPGMDDDAEQRDYIERRYGVRWAKDADGDIYFQTLEGVVPMADLPKAVDPGELFNSGLGPIPKAVVALAGYELGTGRALKTAQDKAEAFISATIPFAGQAQAAARKDNWTALPWEKESSWGPLVTTVSPVNPFKTFNGPKTIERKLDEIDKHLRELQDQQAQATPDLQPHYRYEIDEWTKRRYRTAGQPVPKYLFVP